MSSTKPSSSYKAQQATIASMTLWDKLDIIPVILTVVTKTLLAALTFPFVSKTSRPKTYYRHVLLTAMRTFTARTNVRQQHYLSPPTDVAYTTFCKKHGLTPRSEVLEDGTRAHWIGEPGAEGLIVNFHGGGYTLPPTPGMFLFIHNLIQHLSAQGKSVSCLFLSYDLSPTAPYPRQLQQASALLSHILTTLHYSPHSILLTGDSAGANLALSLLSHLTHPHPDPAIPPVQMDGSLKGVVLTSPWISFEMNAESFERNGGRDVVSIQAGTTWSTAFLRCPWPHSSAIDAYNQPGGSLVSASWFKDYPSVVDEVLIVCGSDEVLVDGITDFQRKLKEGMGEERVRFVVGVDEYHDAPSLDLGLGYKESEEGVQAREIKRWIGSKF
ncbi:alpha/beta-hydrolase [Mollisia scopiformis]|uniref:Alpha/beta-hydrolase n=1 Tax=Mollisia scopiformis TaxID=149040 RepID=A0A194XJ43_MOLSC|nr:alpha/beta-hydrolase [Mollisia scopiformis]KUJ19772.1 alpha/beta-hydrolase [Mollisia scopiformis]